MSEPIEPKRYGRPQPFNLVEHLSDEQSIPTTAYYGMASSDRPSDTVTPPAV
ncbi:hypothetical protein [Sphingomonas sp. PAMC 26617]|uniref:hypothetical protein n=1 Tax=Sphingomonas sp. PAMC 26617 TaxID=1112216 RepID=UPI00031E6A79|nr:hypothetical protein [Sphingomonas sp. PAMC 26617]